jgi:leucyl-tRNA synthetase
MVVFGMGLLNGAKMSSSKGNVFLLEDAIQEFGADTVRMFLVGSAEPWQDFDWRNELVSSTKKQIERFWNVVHDSLQASGQPVTIDRWLISRLQYHIIRTTECFESFQTRQALQESFFSIEADLKWYRRRLPPGSPGSASLMTLCSTWVRLLAPIIPFTCEHLWHVLGQEGLVSFAPWPSPDPASVSPEIELAEELLMRTVEDVESIEKIIQITPAMITLLIAPDWKHDVFKQIARAPDKNMVIREIMKDPAMRSRGKEVTDATRQCTTLIHRLPPQLVDQLARGGLDEKAVFEEAREFLEREFGVPVRIVDAGDSPHTKAGSALPFKPAIIIE